MPCRWAPWAWAGFYALTLGVSWQLGPGRLKVGKVQLTADDLTMKNPTYFGLTKDGGRYADFATGLQATNLLD